ncbi:hypothetical protein KAH81_07020 [bacterium]|nr:hypothetical protein [bacterium]
MKRVTILIILLIALCAYGQMAVKTIVVKEDTLESNSSDAENISEDIGKTVAKIVAEALDDIDLDDEDIQEIRIAKEIYHGAQRDSDDEECYSHGIHRGRHSDWEKPNKIWGQPAMFLFIIVWLGVVLIFFIMWIITLAIVGKGFSKIAKAIEANKEK